MYCNGACDLYVNLQRVTHDRSFVGRISVHRFDGDPVRGSTLTLHMEESRLSVSRKRDRFFDGPFNRREHARFLIYDTLG